MSVLGVLAVLMSKRNTAHKEMSCRLDKTALSLASIDIGFAGSFEKFKKDVEMSLIAEDHSDSDRATDEKDESTKSCSAKGKLLNKSSC